MAIVTRNQQAQAKSKIGRELIFGLVTIACVFITLISAWEFYSLDRQLHEQGARRLEDISNSLEIGAELLSTRSGGKNLQRLVSNLAFNNDVSEIVIIDEKGIVVAHSDSRFNRRAYDTIPDRYLAQALKDASSSIEKRWIALKRGIQGKKDAYLYSIRGVTGPLIGEAGAIGLIAVSLDLTRDIKQNREDLLLSIGISAMYLLLVTLIVAFMIRRLVTSPIDRLVKACDHSLASGEFSLPKDIPPNEVGVLAHAFARTSDSLERSNQELDDFAYIVSHDLKAPLRAIGSLSDILYSENIDSLDDESKEMLQLLKGRVERMQDLIVAILDYSRVGRHDLDKVEIDVHAEVVDLVDALDFPDNVHVQLPDDLGRAYYSRAQLQQVFQNLINNAVSHCDKSEVKIDILFNDTPTEYEYGVRDNGPGIRPEYRDRIFKMFQTLRTKDKFESTGVGLTIVKKVVEQNNGRIWVQSEEPDGCTFFFTIPK